MKLFMLSLLWRASVTNRPLFKDVDLGEVHEERLRQILLNKIEIDEWEYPIILTSFLRTNHDLKNLIGQPKRVRYKNGLNGYVFMIDSIEFQFFVNSINHKLPEFVSRTMLKKNGEMTILHLKNGQELTFLKALLNK